ncbi:dead deah box helicase domain-containing protein, partial [Cystoisospora suis]
MKTQKEPRSNSCFDSLHKNEEKRRENCVSSYTPPVNLHLAHRVPFSLLDDGETHREIDRMKAHSMTIPSVGDLFPLVKPLKLSLYHSYHSSQFLFPWVTGLKLFLSILCLHTFSTDAGVEYVLATSFSSSFRKSTFLTAIPGWNERHQTNGVYVQPRYPPPPSGERVSTQKRESRSSHLFFYGEDGPTILSHNLSSFSLPSASYRPGSLLSSSYSLSSSPSSLRTPTRISPSVGFYSNGETRSLRGCSGVSSEIRSSCPSFLSAPLLFSSLEKKEITSSPLRRIGACRDRKRSSLQAIRSPAFLCGSIQRGMGRRSIYSRARSILSVVSRGGGGSRRDLGTGDNRCRLMMNESMTPLDFSCRLVCWGDKERTSQARGRGGWSHLELGSHTGREREISSSSSTSHFSFLCGDIASSFSCSSSSTMTTHSLSSSPTSTLLEASSDHPSPLPLPPSSPLSPSPSPSSSPFASSSSPSPSPSSPSSSSSSSPPSSPSLLSPSSSNTPLSSSSFSFSSSPSSFFFSNPIFANLPLPPYLSAALHLQGVTSPTGIQAASILLGAAGQDVLLHAETGGGKTFSFLLPILHWHHHSQQTSEFSSCNKKKRTSDSSEESLERNLSQKHYRLIFGEQKSSPSISDQRHSSFLSSSSSSLSSKGEEKKSSRDTRVQKKEKKKKKGRGEGRADTSTDASGVCTPEPVRGESQLRNEENSRVQRGEEEQEYEEEEERLKSESFLSYAGCLDSPEVIEALKQGSAFSLILTPTRELALQISHEIHSLLRTHFFIPPRKRPPALSLFRPKAKTPEEKEKEDKREREREEEHGQGEEELKEEEEDSKRGEERERCVSSVFPSLSRRQTIAEMMYQDIYQKIEDLERKIKDLTKEQEELRKSSYLEEKVKQRKLAALAVRLSGAKRSLERKNEERCLIEIHLSQSLGEGKRPRLLLLLDEPLRFMSSPSQAKGGGEEEEGEREDCGDQGHLQRPGEKTDERGKKKKKSEKNKMEENESAFMSGLRNPRELPQWMKDKMTSSSFILVGAAQAFRQLLL